MAQEWYRKASVQTAVISSIALVIVTIVMQWSPKTELEKKVLDLENENRRLETRLAPFVALAAERFGGNSDLALSRLSAQLADLEAKLKRAEGTIRSLEVEVFVTVSGDWTSNSLPDFSSLYRSGRRASDVTGQFCIKESEFRQINFEDGSAPRFTQGEKDKRVLDYRASAPAGCWIFGAHKSDLSTCKYIEVQLYGVDRNSTKNNILTVENVTLVIYINGLPTHKCVFPTPFKESLPEGSIKVRLDGPVKITPLH